MAHHQSRNVSEAQENIRASEIPLTMAFMEMKLKEREKIEHYLARLTAEVAAFRSMFSSSPKGFSAEDFYIKWKDGSGIPEEERKAKTLNPEESEESDYIDPETGEKVPKGGIVMGPDALKDPKWAALTALAKAAWAARLGVPSLDRLHTEQTIPEFVANPQQQVDNAGR